MLDKIERLCVPAQSKNKYIIQLVSKVITEGLLVSPNSGHPHPEIVEGMVCACMPPERGQHVSVCP